MPTEMPAPPDGDDGPRDVVGEEEGTPAPFSCPECSGVLSEVHDGTLLRFRCQIGHRYSPQSVVAHQKTALERSLAGALTAVNERGLLLSRLAEDARRRGDPRAARRFAAQAQEAEVQREHLLHLLDGIREVLDHREDDLSAGSP